MNRIIFSLFTTTIYFLTPYAMLGMDNPRMDPSQLSSFSNPKLFEFPFLHGWGDMDQSQQKGKLEEIDTKAKPKIEEGIRARIQKDYTRAKEAFLDSSALGSELAMTQLGHMAIAEGNYEESFHWYNLAQHTGFLKTGTYSQGPSATGIFQAATNDLSLLNRSEEYLCFINTLNRYNFSKHPISIRAQFLISQFSEKPILYPSSNLNDNFYWGLAVLAGEPVWWERLGWLYDGKKLGQNLNDENRYQREANCFWHANTPEGWYALGNLILEKRVQHTHEGKPISDLARPLLAAECYRKSGLPKSFFSLGVMIHDKIIHRDENNHSFEEKDRDKATARCLLKAGTPKSFHHIAELLREKKIKCNIQGQFIDTDVSECFYTETASAYYRKANLPLSRLALAGLIASKTVNTDDSGKKITSEREYRQAIVRCLEGLKREDFYFETDLKAFIANMGAYIEQGILNYDEEGKKIKSEKHRGKTAARYFREAGTSLAFSNLSGLILVQLTDLDEFGKDIHTDEERFQAAERCCSENYPHSFYNLALIILYRYSHLLDYKERALNYASEAISFGDDLAVGLYIQIKNEIEKAIQPLKKEEIKETKKPEAEINSGSSETIDESDRAYLGTIEEEITPEARKKMKEIAKKLKNHRGKYKKLLQKQISEKEFNGMLESQSSSAQRGFHVTWSRDAIKQFRTLPKHEAKKVLYLIHLIKEGDTRTGRPETLKGEDHIITRRIDKGDRLAYRLTENGIYIVSSKEHVEK